MSNWSEEAFSEFEESEYKELMEYWGIEESWENNPMKIKLEKQIEVINQEINSLIKNWPEIDE